MPAHVAVTRRCWFSNLIRGFERRSRARGSSEFDEKRNQATAKKPPEKQHGRTPCDEDSQFHLPLPLLSHDIPCRKSARNDLALLLRRSDPSVYYRKILCGSTVDHR